MWAVIGVARRYYCSSDSFVCWCRNRLEGGSFESLCCKCHSTRVPQLEINIDNFLSNFIMEIAKNLRSDINLEVTELGTNCYYCSVPKATGDTELMKQL